MAERLRQRWRQAFAVWRRLLPYLRPHRRRLVTAGGLALLAVVLELLKPWPIKVVVDQVLLGRDWQALPADWRGDATLLTWLAIGATLLFALLGGIAEYWRDLRLAEAGQKAISTVRSRALDAVLAQSLEFHERHRAGDLLVRLCGDAQNLRTLLIDGLFSLGREATLVIGTLAVMVAVDWRLGLAALAVLPLVTVLAALASIRLRAAARKQRKKEGELAASAHETLAAVPVIQAYGLESIAAETFGKQNRKSARSGLKATRIEGRLGLATDVALAIGIANVLWLGVARVQQGALTPGELLVVLAYARSFYRPIRKGLGRSAAVVKAAAAGERVLELLDARSALPRAAKPRQLAAVRGAITLQDVHFTHADGREVLRGVDLTIAPGEHVALVGGNGAGKSTLASLLVRLRDPGRGRVLFDGVDVKELAPEALRLCVAVVMQETLLFAGSLRDNVRLGRPDASDEDVAAACELAGVTALAAQWPDGIDTVLGDRGADLSGGERQRVALARALVRNAAVLVLDEPTTGLDAAAESRLCDRILTQLRGRTVVLITHNPRLCAAADRVVRLHDGRIEPVAASGIGLAGGVA